MGKRKNQALIDSDSSNDSTSDLDSEFLNLAKKKNRKKKSPKSNSDSEYDGKSDSDSSRTKKKQKRDSVSSDSESEKKEDIKNNSEPEEGEVSDSSISDEEYNDGYDDQLMGDEEDRARLASLTEKERETEIFKRIEQRELMKTRFEIEKKLRQAKKAERAREKPHRHKDKEKEKDRDHSKLQTDFTSIDHKERSKERKKNIEENRGRVDKRVNAMAELKARREDKQKREEAEEKRKEEQRKKEEEDATHSTNKSAVKLKASDIYSDDSESEECLQEVKAHLTNQDNQGGLLDLALHLVPVQGLRVRHGNQERVFRLEFVSNQEFTDNEYHKWIEASTAAGNALPTKEHVEQKQADIKEALNYEFNEQDIERIIREKERFKPNPHNYAMRKTQLMKERDSALARGDEELTRELGQKLSDLEERASELDKLRTSTISSISYINDRNRKRNVEEAEKAIMAEIKANKGKKIDDPFTRRSTKPRMNFKAAPEEKMEMVVETKPEKVTIEVENPKVPAQPAQVTQDDLFSAHDFDIKIDLDVPLPGNLPYKASGVTVADACKTTYEEIKKDKKHRYVIFYIKDERQIDVENLQAGGAGECRYGLYDFEYMHQCQGTAESSKKQKLFLMSWCPDTAKVKKKMLYSSSFDALKKSLVGVQKYIQATDLSEASQEAVEEKLRATDRQGPLVSSPRQGNKMINQNFYFLNYKKKNWETEAKPESVLGATSFTAPTICGIVPAGFAAKEKKVKTNLAANEDTRDKNNKKGTKKNPLSARSAVRRRGCENKKKKKEKMGHEKMDRSQTIQRREAASPEIVERKRVPPAAP
ncbi:hypothetical protein GEV33_010078 [Tenebrio molitor]|uniref:ADF-H domain-containing protein n=1 Tax=Tenebrio molitor TaxID=7067 RepID=A0A8J6HE40_TENMO|nr:hypothetical protein GEV33_010078 [Tenebrio molitor]